MAPQNLAQSITQDLPFSIGEGQISYGSGPSQWVKKCSMAALMVPWTPWNPSLWVNFGLGDSDNPYGPPTLRHAKDQKDPKRPKRPLITVASKIAIVMARTQNAQGGPTWPKTNF
ncbi:hypothetical protein O181_096671 [Austropuccinia psidii MF-1]|uniref:Uncharacterized protein n=1 Tax=Austropuccinia psidii MF-1 TaxID=1389203 RepID=A0A9Q3PEE5_9BASI|nr:hypothetical protein [Austropuccinia psidii MF-1]